jgi:hypothetical protein
MESLDASRCSANQTSLCPAPTYCTNGYRCSSVVPASRATSTDDAQAAATTAATAGVDGR